MSSIASRRYRGEVWGDAQHVSVWAWSLFAELDSVALRTF